MAVACNCEVATNLGLITAATAVTAAGVTWLVSSVTNPLIGGALGAVASAVTVATLYILKNVLGVHKDNLLLPLAAAELITPIAFALAATALGYAVSIPLALLLTVTNVVSQMAIVSLLT